VSEKESISGIDQSAENPLAKDPKFEEAARRFQAWATKYKPLCFIELVAVKEQLPPNLAGHLWTKYSWDHLDLIETGYLQNDMVMGYVVTQAPAPSEQRTLLETWIQEVCSNCGGLGEEDEGSVCTTCGGFLEYEFSVPYEYPQVLSNWEEIEAFSAHFQPPAVNDQARNGSERILKQFDDDFAEDSDFFNIANIIWNFQFEASNQDRENLQWRSEGLNPVDSFIDKYDELFILIEQFIEDEIDPSELNSKFADQVSTCWNDLCALYHYEGDQTFDGDFDEFTDYFNVLHYNDMGLSIQSELFTIFGGKEVSDEE
jgi:hypothetical protein